MHRSVGIKKRACAFLFDMMVLLGILVFVYYFVPESSNVAVLNEEFNSVNDLLFGNKIDFLTYLNRVSIIMQDLDKERIIYSLFNAIYIVTYFVIIPWFTKKTLGMHIMGLNYYKKSGEISLDDLLVRSMVTCGLLYLLASLVLIYALPSVLYFVLNIFFAILQISLAIISIFMVIYRKDNRGLQDMWSKIIVVNEK